MSNYPAYCYVKIDGATLVVEDDLSYDDVNKKYSADEDLQVLGLYAGSAHTGDIVKIGETLVIRRNA